jgi:O-antigen ligase
MAMALVVGRSFVPGMAIADRGYGAIFVVLWLLLLAAWLIARVKAAAPPLRWSRSDALVLAFFLIYTFSGVVAVWQGSPRPAINVSWHWLSIGIAYFLFRQLIQGSVARRGAIAVMIGMSASMAAMGLEQALFSLPDAQAVYARFQNDPRELYVHTGQWLPEGSAERQLFEARLRAAEPTATLALANSLAGLLVPAITLATGILAGQARSLHNRRLQTLWIAPPLMALVGCLVFTNSRSGLAASLVASLTAVLLCTKRPLHWSIGIGAAVCLIGFTFSLLRPQRFGEAARSLAFRQDYWQATRALIEDYPLLGCGPGQFQDTYTAYKLADASEEVADPHNFVLEVWATGGTISGAAFLAALAAVACHTYGIGQRKSPIGDAEPPHAFAPPRELPYVYGGALAGVPLGAGVAWVDGLPVSAAHVGLAASALVATLAILHRWVIDGGMPRWLPALAAGGLLLHLSVSGGIGEPALATMLWLLIAIQFDVFTPLPTTGKLVSDASGPQGWDRSLARMYSVGALISTVALIVTTYATYYRPVLSAATHMARADGLAFAGQNAAHLQAVEAAVNADPWSAEAARRLANARFARWQQDRAPEFNAEWQQSDNAARRLAPRRHAIWRESAERYAALFRESGNEDALAQAIAHADQAVALYPTHADHHLYCAELLIQAGRRSDARSQLARAADLDQTKSAAGHTDKLLPPDRRELLESLAKDLGLSLPPARQN